MTETIQETGLAASVNRALEACGVTAEALGGDHEARSPLTGEVLLTVPSATADEVNEAITKAHEAFLEWREVPAPVRGNVIKRWGELLTEHKEDLAVLVQAEAGKITSEALGEVQEMIDICDFAVGPVPDALRQDHAVRAPGPPAAGNMAPPRRRRCHFRLQLPRRRVLLEHRPGAGLR
jgi:aldehyde dehydrogenase (NAD+)